VLSSGRERLKRATRFDETLTVTCWIERVSHAALAFGYQLHCGDQLTALARVDRAFAPDHSQAKSCAGGRHTQPPRPSHSQSGGVYVLPAQRMPRGHPTCSHDKRALSGSQPGIAQKLPSQHEGSAISQSGEQDWPG
jgi:hypothetical protein